VDLSLELKVDGGLSLLYVLKVTALRYVCEVQSHIKEKRQVSRRYVFGVRTKEWEFVLIPRAKLP
jgi:hypothetical protein